MTSSLPQPTPASGLTDVYHVGIVVTHLEDAMTEFGRTFSTTFAHHFVDVAYVDESGHTRQARIHSALSRDGHLRIELIEEQPGTVWVTPADNASVHHVGAWSADVAADVARLRSEGCTVIARGSGEVDFAYLRRPDGAIIELVTAALRERMFAWAAGTGDDYVTAR